MLARHAESLFWMGRYVERAEHTSRLLDVAYHTQLQATTRTSERAWEDLLRSLDLDDTFEESGAALDADSVADFLVLDADNPSSIAGAVRVARENARSVRELLSTELWEATNRFHLDLGRRDLRFDLTTHPHELYLMVRTMCQAITGIAHESMDRGEGFLFLELGRMVERAMLQVRLIDVRFAELEPGERSDYQHWMLTLRTAAGSEAFRRNHHGTHNAGDVLAFLLLSTTFPRSVRYSVSAAERALVDIESSSSTRPMPRRLVGRIRADLEFANAHELLDTDLHDYLDRIHHELTEAAEAIAEEYFRLVRDPVVAMDAREGDL